MSLGPRGGPKPDAGPMQGRKGKGGRQAARGGKRNGPSPRQGGGNSFPFSKFIFCSNLLKRISKTNLNLKKQLHSIKYMQQHECTYMFLDLIMDFISTKINFLLFLSAHKQLINSIRLFGKSEIFRVLQFYPPEDESRPRDSVGAYSNN